MFNKIKSKLFKFFTSIKKVDLIYDEFSNDYKSPKMLLGKILYNQIKDQNSTNLQDFEFQVFSQWGDDGIIQHIVNKIKNINKTFVEIGVEDYKESNTRYLIMNNNWSGLIVDGAEQNMEAVKQSPIYYMNDIHPVASFVTKENINEIIENNFLNKGYEKNIDLLSIDIDGNDYWVWDAVDCIKPTIVVMEYNAFLSVDKPLTIKYDKDFVWDRLNKPFYWGQVCLV